MGVYRDIIDFENGIYWIHAAVRKAIIKEEDPSNALL